ncbi:hypothetical protein [Undibacterium hunanense]|uniref:hypothetical protein n=1 Tax=Undibacterium hunanense TaxID=2762292 RepID=UPI001C9B7592|nr:hypothetical protein [Undibacterium hunanense]
MAHLLPVALPKQVLRKTCVSSIILRGLNNPRGIKVKPDGRLLLVEAGTGYINEAEQAFSGRLLQFRCDATGVYGQMEVVAAGFRSMNMQARMCRDEIFGLADVAYGGGRWLLSQTDYVSGSRIMDLSALPPQTLFHSRGNLNSLCYHPKRQSWLTVKPDTNQAIEFVASKPEALVGVLPDLTGGQHAVPVTVILDQSWPQSNGSQPVLISLFSGELQGDADKLGIHFEKGVSKVVRLDLDTGEVSPVIEGLTLATGMAFTDQGQLLVLELCEDFLQPMPVAEVPQIPWHGGFKRYSGRLLCFDLARQTVHSLAEHLDTPSNLCVVGNSVFISEGMGLPGRPIANASGETVALEGYVRKLILPENP